MAWLSKAKSARGKAPRVEVNMLALTRVVEQRREHCCPGHLWLLHIHIYPEERRQYYTNSVWEIYLFTTHRTRFVLNDNVNI